MEAAGLVVEEPASFAMDYGRMRRVQPDLVIRLRSTEAAAVALAIGRECDVPMTARGSGHSCGGQALSPRVVLVNEFEQERPAWVDEDRLSVSSRLTWRAVEQAARARGRSVPVLPDELDMTVGGTLSVGGVGTTSVVHGLQIDGVEALQLVTPARGVIHCSETQAPDLFRCALAGLGQVGLLDRFTLRTVPHRPHLQLSRTRLDGLAALGPALWRVAKRADVSTFQAHFDKRDLVVEVGTHTSRATGQDHVDALEQRRRRWLAPFAKHLKYWTDYVLPIDEAQAFIEVLERVLPRPPLARVLRAVYVLMIRRPQGGMRFPLAPAPASGMYVGFGLYTMFEPTDLPALSTVPTLLDALLMHCLELGGRPYLYGAHRLSDPRLERAYGRDLAAVKRAREATCGRFAWNPACLHATGRASL